MAAVVHPRQAVYSSEYPVSFPYTRMSFGLVEIGSRHLRFDLSGDRSGAQIPIASLGTNAFPRHLSWVPMWADADTNIDFLNYSEIAELIAEMIARPALLPLSLGVFGSWGVGKSSTLRLVANELGRAKDKYLIL
jgi:KAP family P-loop domain